MRSIYDFNSLQFFYTLPNLSTNIFYFLILILIINKIQIIIKAVDCVSNFYFLFLSTLFLIFCFYFFKIKLLIINTINNINHNNKHYQQSVINIFTLNKY